MKNNVIEEFVTSIKAFESTNYNDLNKFNPIDKEILKVVENEEMTPVISELIDKLILLSKTVSGKTEVPFFESFHIYEIFDAEIVD